ncbi:MAG: dihydropteroate synthase [Spirochaetia bacterium]|nr:dihydropteroate synthase [Spirochaetia bacterium]MBP5739970.1 dihydropteroate synthase [Spirochaetia bacterium]
MGLISSLYEKKKMPLVMGILNVTPDSFYAASRKESVFSALEAALEMESSGADIIDIGAESTRPGFTPVEAEEEIKRIIPAIEEIRKHTKLPISVDTRKGSVAKAALDAGADIVNDISAGTYDFSIIEIVKNYKCDIILMHSQEKAQYSDVVSEVKGYLLSRAETFKAAGVPADKITLDPGLGFGKDTEHNLLLMRNMEQLAGLGYPVLIGCSRKRFIGAVTGSDVDGRLAGTLAVNAFAASHGAAVLRVHDVRETSDMVKMLFALGDIEVRR